MDRKRFQFSLFGLLAFTTACSVLLSLVKTFPNEAARAPKSCIVFAWPWLFVLGIALAFDPTLFFPDRTRIVHVYARLAGLLCIITGSLIDFFSRQYFQALIPLSLSALRPIGFFTRLVIFPPAKIDQARN